MATEAIEARFCLAYPGFTLDVDLQLPGRGVSALFGHSGSGKTSLLRCIAGLERAPQGYLSVAGEVWQDGKTWQPTHKRPLGYVFQEASLFPHLDVLGNLRYGLRRVKDAPPALLEQSIELLGIGHLLKRHPDQLSGGERQRVGIARALAVAPRLLLMDEPLAALDLKRKLEVLPYLERLHEELEIPVLYVSHAPDEVARLADHLVLLEEGRVRASGPLKETLLRADLPSVFEEEAEAVVEGRVSGHDAAYGLLSIQLPGSGIELRLPHSALPLQHRVRVKIKARDVSLSLRRAEGSSMLNLLPAQLLDWLDTPGQSHRLVRLQVAGEQLLARITRYSFDQLGLQKGQQVWAQIKSVALA